MFEINQRYNINVPIKVWLSDKENMEQSCLDEAVKLAQLPFAEKHVALMPDCHASSFNMPIGSVLATENVIVPEAVSNDIGCGISFKLTNVDADVMNIKTDSGKLKQMLVGDIMRDIPTGFEHRKSEENLDNQKLKEIIYDYMDDDGTIGGVYEVNPREMDEVIKESHEIVGTLGGNNHFIELQENENGKLGIMIHSGSRSVGAKVNKYFNDKAKELNDKWYVNAISDNIHMPFLPIESKVGQQYIKWMNFALEIAALNRKTMMDIVVKKLEKVLSRYADIDKINYDYNLNVHHNYAEIENVDGKNYWAHRKGAVRARKSDIVPIAGAMGSYSYICQGKGNDDSFYSCSHGAGRTHTRTAAKEEFSVQEMMEDLNNKGVILGKKDKSDAQDEFYKAYKNIETVMENQTDLVDVLEKMKTIVVVKG
jgi:tRNA-splicing ligase RtcB